MRVVNVDRFDVISSSATSKGNQRKWYHDGKWYKADDMGYEGLAEWTASVVMLCSDLFIDEFVQYERVIIETKGKHVNGCVSNNFLNEGESIITFHRLFESHIYPYEKEILSSGLSAGEKIHKTIEVIKDFTEVDVTDYLRKVLTLDAFILNEDRHPNNLALLRELNGKFRPCPIFDNGLSLLADTHRDYPLDEPTVKLIKTVKSRPFSTDFEKQRKILGKGFSIHKEALLDFVRQNDKELGRVAQVLTYNINKYPELMV